MKHRLTIRYFLWIAGFMLFCYALNTAIDYVNDHDPINWIIKDQSGAQLRETTVSLIYNLAALPFVLLAAWFVSRRLLAPLHRIAIAAEKISGGNLGERIAYKHPGDEIGRVVTALNRAFDGYGESLERQKRFAANAAHQLRTPLTAMRSVGEVCLRDERAPAEYRETITAMLERLERLTRTCEQLLELSRLDTPTMRERMNAFDPAETFRAVTDAFTPVAQDRRITLRAELAGGIQVNGNPELIAEIAGNLLDNAIRCAPEHGEVLIFWKRAGALTAEFGVEDNGPGIPEDMRARVFEPFNQGGQPSDGGAGLGLAIVAEIARVHGGSVKIEKSPIGGARIAVMLPTGD